MPVRCSSVRERRASSCDRCSTPFDRWRAFSGSDALSDGQRACTKDTVLSDLCGPPGSGPEMVRGLFDIGRPRPIALLTAAGRLASGARACPKSWQTRAAWRRLSTASWNVRERHISCPCTSHGRFPLRRFLTSFPSGEDQLLIMQQTRSQACRLWDSNQARFRLTAPPALVERVRNDAAQIGIRW